MQVIDVVCLFSIYTSSVVFMRQQRRLGSVTSVGEVTDPLKSEASPLLFSHKPWISDDNWHTLMLTISSMLYLDHMISKLTSESHWTAYLYCYHHS